MLEIKVLWLVVVDARACGLAAHCVEEHAYLFTVPYEAEQMSNLFDSHKEDTLMNDPQ
jgi:hypothetical protein